MNKPFEQITPADFENVYKVNVFAVAELTRICIPYLSKGSHVVTISSMGRRSRKFKISGISGLSLQAKEQLLPCLNYWPKNIKNNKSLSMF